MLFNIMRYITEKLSPTLPEGMVNVEAADMANIDNLIESCKSVIEVGARQIWVCFPIHKLYDLLRDIGFNVIDNTGEDVNGT